MIVQVTKVASWFGFADGFTDPISGIATCRECGSEYKTDTFGMQVATDMIGKYWYTGVCDTCKAPDLQLGAIHDALESLFDEIYRQEDWAALEDRIDQQIRLNTILDEKKKRERK